MRSAWPLTLMYSMLAKVASRATTSLSSFCLSDGLSTARSNSNSSVELPATAAGGWGASGFGASAAGGWGLAASASACAAGLGASGATGSALGASAGAASALAASAGGGAAAGFSAVGAAQELSSNPAASMSGANVTSLSS